MYARLVLPVLFLLGAPVAAQNLLPSSSGCTGIAVTTVADSGPGSLRQAILDANATAEPDAICFAIPGGGVHTIALASALPAIMQPVVIDGYTQPGASENTLEVGSDAVVRIELDGSAAGDDANGLLLTGSGITVRGLAVGDFDGDLVRIEGGGENVAEGAEGLGNGLGITFENAGTSGNRVGGTAEGAGNVIAFNTAAGVHFSDAGAGNTILGNSIHSNGGLGIDFFGDGPTENDAGDADAGPNGLQNFPVLTAAGPTSATGTLDSTPDAAFRIEFFSSAEADPSGYGEGEVYLGFVDVTTDGSGQAVFTFDAPEEIPAGHVVAATATDTAGSTSEFSSGVAVPVAAEEGTTPTVSALHAPYPNPLRARATLRYGLVLAAPVRLVVCDVLGREVAVLVDGERPAGRHEAILDGQSWPSGVYLLRMTTGSFAQTRRLTLLR